MARELSILGTTAIVRVPAGDTDSKYAVVEQSGGPGDLTPPHANANEDIALAVVEGEIEVETASGSQKGAIGSTFSLPRGTHHTIRATGAGTARLLYVFTPGGVEAFFEEVDSLGGAATPEKVGEIAANYGIKIGPPS